MTPIEILLDKVLTINILNVWLIAKIFVLLALGVYIAFAFMVAKEVKLMTKTLIGVFNLPIKILSYIHLVLTIIIFLLALKIL
ncbi:hypothetical protein COT75_02620 [Candidatus Beckwithbacteria bacterium CG10_big_fil_rev_8_21_14_0_10_34_10]|uniref:Uncharacterized protein n=1 Tax=Candidatus Beckwithbacteria bacterium CG10_big_fil_rev_8_21_14_0_10_34_10 TaxID=1974495 RepID=A0A2H0W9A1_9BACT|nr:MAG: hypothetical protein COT75_02620 [Candidatus Beckwithbacteria bacterium CG10_big_fil_rev_8_21_14_0_10_34_10]